jgi:hypothetical protein
MALWRPKGKNGKRSKVWWCSFEFCGEPIRFSTKTRSKTVAAEVQRARRREVELSYNGIKKREMPKTFSVAVNEHLDAKEGAVAPSTFEIMKRCASHLRSVFGKMLIIDITASHIKKYKHDRLTPTTSPRYVNMDLELIRAVLRRNGLWEKIRPDFKMFRLDEEFGYELPEDEEETLVPSGANLEFTKDTEFNSPSAAAAVVRGGSANGLTAWRTQDGTTLKQLDEQA